MAGREPLSENYGDSPADVVVSHTLNALFEEMRQYMHECSNRDRGSTFFR